MTNLREFLRGHIATEKSNYTHTKIGNRNLNVFGGSYTILKEDLPLFYKLYNEEVFENGKREYLTERQLREGTSDYTNPGQILVDLDFRYDSNITTRQHTEDHLMDIIEIYMNKIKQILNIEPGIDIPVYILEKPDVNMLQDETKDGIHIIIGIGMDHTLQLLLRKLVIEDIHNVLGELPLTNDYESVFDKGISEGYTNWQLYGSCKPGYDTYKLVKHIIYTLGTTEKICDTINDKQFSIKFINPNTINNLSLLQKISARNSECVTFEINPEYKDKYMSFKSTCKSSKPTSSRKIKHKLTREEFNFDIEEISTIEELTELTKSLLDNLSYEDYKLKETHEFLMCLPKKYYDEYNEWIRVGWALKNCDFRMFLSWMLFSSQSDKFNFSDIPGNYEAWDNFKDEGFTERSIRYWAKIENPIEFKKINQSTLTYLMHRSIKGGEEWEIAKVIHHYYRDKFRCASLKSKTWYEYVGHKWNEIDCGYSLRYKISSTISELYGNYSLNLISKSSSISNEDSVSAEKMSKDAKIYSIICSKLKQTNFKQNVMKELSEVFYKNDPDFYNKLDQNRNLICFTNGVYDFEEKCFRNGRPEDYVSLCTQIKYVKFNENNPDHVMKQQGIDNFMKQLFPVEELRQYIWNHLASVLIGYNKAQTFNIYNGNGSNGKSKLVEFMSMCLGDYKGTVPITLVTQKRTAIGSVSPEIAALKGLRYAVMQEPSKNDKLNDGMLKELTGEDPIQGRAMYKEPVTFVPQFKLVVCTNNLFDIASTDDGTWRRIRLCEFQAKFRDTPKPSKDSPYEFKINYNIPKLFTQWKELFMSKLIDIAKDTQGIVKDCSMVLKASTEYRKTQDFFMEFYDDKIEKGDSSDRIKKDAINQEFKVWYTETYSRNVPKIKELHTFLNKKLGKPIGKKGWIGYKIRYDDEELDPIIDT